MGITSFEKYRTVDLAIMSAALFLTEFLSAKAASEWFPFELYTLSPTVAVLCIVMMRWGGFAFIQALVGGAAFCIASGGNIMQLVTYCAGNCLALIALLMFKAFGKEKIRTQTHLTLIFTVIAFCGAQLGRGLVSVLFGAPFDTLGAFFAADSLSLVFAAVVVLISRRIDGLFEDQKSYLIRTEAERRKENSEF